MASGDTLCVFTPLQNEPPSTNYATLDTRNQHPVLDFSASTNESGVLSDIMPRNYGGGGVTVYYHFAMTSATTGNVDIDGDFERIGDAQQDIGDDGFTGSPQSVNDTDVPGTNGHVKIVSKAFTDGAQMDSIAVGEGFRFKVTRDSASDTAAGDMELLFVEIKET